MRRSVHVRHGIRPLAVAVVVTIGLLAAGAAGAASLQRTYLGQVASEELGRAVADAGDVNGDGQGDVIVGVSGFDGSRGRVRVFSGADGAILWTFVGESANDQFGKAVAGNVDVNNDGAPDLIVGAPNRATGNGNGSGKAYVFSGATGALLYSWDGEAALDNFGISVDGAGNVNGGAFDDILVGARNGGANNTGRVYVYSGFNGSLLRGHDGSVADGDFGSALARAGDMTGDGREEYIAGSPFHAGGEGRAYVFDGASGAVLAFMDGEPGFFSRFGYAVSGAGDIDGDGLTEIVVGAWKFNPPPDGDERGKVYVYGLNAVGAPPNLLHTWVGEANQDYFGISVSGAGD
ncbi:MAG: FG-GAP repeat protein, partial [Myxococcales bacterium]|nr:FG-GAP repeat protein [Myxococcales bacterium]